MSTCGIPDVHMRDSVITEPQLLEWRAYYEHLLAQNNARESKGEGTLRHIAECEQHLAFIDLALRALRAGLR